MATLVVLGETYVDASMETKHKRLTNLGIRGPPETVLGGLILAHLSICSAYPLELSFNGGSSESGPKSVGATRRWA